MPGAAIYMMVWTALGLFFGAQRYVDYSYAGQPITWTQAIVLGLSEWYIWALLSLVLARLARSFPFEKGRRLKSLAVQAPATLVVTLVKLAAYGPVVDLSGVPPLRAASMETFNLSLLTCWMILGANHALQQYRSSQARRKEAAELETRLARAQLQLLRTQLQPHFLFNTLHAVTALIRRDADAAEEMLARLSDLLRLALERGEIQELPLKEELDFVHLYIRIQEVRFGDRLRVAIQAEPDVLDAMVPNMLLQPLVENAVQHGVSRRAEGGEITVTAKREQDMLVVRICDDGPGLHGDDAPGLGIGLTNTRERLERLYGERHALRLEQAPGGGLEVVLELPLLFGDQDGPEGP